MKFLLILSVFLLVAVFFVEAQDDYRTEYCKTPPQTKGRCFQELCNKDDTMRIGKGCAESRCPGETLKIIEDKSKPYPYCCPEPICKDVK